jgi:Secretion system C-terminal sorting domain
MKKIFYIFSLLLINVLALNAQTTYCLGYDVVSNTSGVLTIQLKLQGSTSFKLGSHNLRFNYNSTALSSPTLVPIAPVNSDLTTVLYNPINLTYASSNSQRFNGLLSTLNTGVTIAASPSWTNLGRVNFTIDNPAQTTGISFNPSFSLVRLDDGNTAILSGSGCPNLDVPLPIEILNFDAVKSNNKIVLNWATANALQMSHFEVEKSKDGKAFERIGQVKAINTIDPTNYKLIDEHPYEGVNYYRLKSVETSGKVAYSKIISIILSGKLLAKIYPNPIESDLNIDVVSDKNNSEVMVELIDVVGKIVDVQKRKITSGTSNITFDTDNLISGTYIVRITNDDNVVQHKIVKN